MNIEQSGTYNAVREYDRAAMLIGTAQCPWQFECEAVNTSSRFLSEFSRQMADEAVILAEMLLATRGEECTHETLNTVMTEAHSRWVSNLRAAEDTGEKLSDDVLGVMEVRRSPLDKAQ